MDKILAFLRKKYMYLIVAAGYLHWCLIVSDFVYMDYSISFKLLLISLGFFGWYLIYRLVRKYTNREDNSNSSEE